VDLSQQHAHTTNTLCFGCEHPTCSQASAVQAHIDIYRRLLVKDIVSTIIIIINVIYTAQI